MEAKDKLVGVRMSKAMEAKARAIALADGRTLSNYILRLIEQDAARHSLQLEETGTGYTATAPPLQPARKRTA